MARAIALVSAPLRFSAEELLRMTIVLTCACALIAAGPPLPGLSL